jgi:Putative peptidoglycan binding domain
VTSIGAATTAATLQKGDKGAEVSRLQRLLQLLGHYDGSIDADFGPETEAAVRSFQKGAAIKVDGIAGPDTWGKLEALMLVGELPLEILRHLLRERNSAELEMTAREQVPPPEPASAGSGDQAEAGGLDAALARAEEEWRRPVMEPNGRGWERIDEYIRGPHGLAWSWEARYTRNQQYAWCGAFVAFCLDAAGMKAELRKKMMPSTYRLYTWAHNTARFLEPESIERGDIAIVGPATGRVWGSHITLCDTVEADGRLRTFEGNARGEGPDGSRYEGVIRQRRPLAAQAASPATYRLLYGIRLLADDIA